MIRNKFKLGSGFTLIELLLVMAILGILSTVLLVAVNPVRQMGKARDSQRESHLYVINSAILEYVQEHGGDLPAHGTTPFPTTSTCIGKAISCFDLGAAGAEGDTIVPVYLREIPKDPRPVNAGEGTDDNTGYYIWADEYNRLTLTATGEVKTNIILAK
jgi:prepilin-type N-terminal cleavage/methylation domain-containing protein